MHTNEEPPQIETPAKSRHARYAVDHRCIDCGKPAAKFRRARCSSCYRAFRKADTATTAKPKSRGLDRVAARLLGKTTPGFGGCWVYTGAVGDQGYGSFTARYLRTVYAHRASYLIFKGDIPRGWTIDHTCHNKSGCNAGSHCVHRRCVNPDHLEAVPVGVNTRRSPNTLATKWGSRTHCSKGHEFTPPNTWWYTAPGVKRPARYCRICLKSRRRRTA